MVLPEVYCTESTPCSYPNIVIFSSCRSLTEDLAVVFFFKEIGIIYSDGLYSFRSHMDSVHGHFEVLNLTGSWHVWWVWVGLWKSMA